MISGFTGKPVLALFAGLLLLALPGSARARCGMMDGASGSMMDGCGHGMGATMGRHMTGDAQAGATAKPLNSKKAEVDTAGEKAFDHVCAKCHALPSPKLHTASQWPEVLERMHQHMVAASEAPPDRKTSQEIEAFLRANAEK